MVALPAGRPLRVALPMANLVPGGMGGTETYAQELVSALRRYDDLEPTVLLPPSAAGMFAPVPERVLPIRGGGSTPARLASISRGRVDPRVSRAVSAMSPDVVHFPFTVPSPSPGRRPWVLTLHDVQHLDLPEHFSFAERTFRRAAYDRAARRADLVITVSEFARARIVDLLSVPSDRVVVAPLGVASRFTPYDGPREPFVLYPARRWPHKNHARLIAAMARLREARPSLRLVLTGGGAKLADAPPWVEQRGLVSEEELASLYRSAACLAFPSLYEGFGMPPLEAMASGCPVAVSNAGALPEVVGNAAVTFDPLHVVDMARAIGEAIDARGRLAPAGQVRAAAFSWQACADGHVAAYRRLAPAD